MSNSKSQTAVQASAMNPNGESLSCEVAVDASLQEEGSRPGPAVGQTSRKKNGLLAYFRTKEFYITLLLGQVLAIANTATGTFTTLINLQHTSIPAFQTFFNYMLLNTIFTSYTIYRYGVKGWLQMVWKHGWKYIILSFCDVEGNYFVVMAYNYTTMLSVQLINFWAIAVVVAVSFIFLRVRYHATQIIGILICIGGMGVLLASDHITGTNGGDVSLSNQVKGDMLALAGATFYGLANTGEEYFVSTRPVYEVLGQMGFFGMIINGVQAAIFDQSSLRQAHWNSKVGAYLAGYTLCLTFFYSMVPLLFRLASAAFLNISLLTMNFWGVIIGVKVFHYTIHFMYPTAFVLIILGQLIYFLGRRVLAEARKPWLGEYQERGVAGVFTARRKIDSDAAAASNHSPMFPYSDHETAPLTGSNANIVSYGDMDR